MQGQNGSREKAKRGAAVLEIIGAVIGVCALLLVCWVFRDRITADQIVAHTPANQAAAVLLMLFLFAIKSCCVLIYCGILYAASGRLFSLPLAIGVNLLGTVVMTSVPYVLGRKAGSRYVARLTDKHPSLRILNESGGISAFLSLMVRLTGILPSDLVSAFFGATKMPYGKYICTTVIGFVPMIIAFSVMGMSIHDVTSPAFIISVCVQLGTMMLSCVIYAFSRRKKRFKKQGDRKC